jgi:fluoroacetyl-CoA thioesterase
MRPFAAGEQATLQVQVSDEMTVRFDQLGALHPVYATYVIAQHFEEAGRLLLLPHLEAGEGGIGSSVQVEHRASALPGMRVRITATFARLEGRRLWADLVAVSELGDTIATGVTGQYVTSQARLEEGFEALRARWQAAARGGHE